MEDRRRLYAEQVVQLVTKLRTLQWSWDRSEVRRILDDIGWVVEAESGYGMRLDTGFGMATGDVELDEGGRVAIIKGAVCPYIDDEIAEERSWLQDVFAEVVAAATSALGEPTDRRPGETPEVRWRGPQSTVGVLRTSVLVKVYLATNEYIDDKDWAASRGL